MNELKSKPKDVIAAANNEELKKILYEVQSCSTSDEFNTLIQLKADAIAAHGCSKIYASDMS